MEKKPQYLAIFTVFVALGIVGFTLVAGAGMATFSINGSIEGIEGNANTAAVSLPDSQVDEIELTLDGETDHLELEPGDEIDAVVIATYDDSTEDVTDDATITIDDENVLTVEDGTVTAVDEGDATITATFDWMTDSVDVTVDADDPGPSPTPDPDPEPPTDVDPPEDVDVVHDEVAESAFDEERDQHVVTFSEDSTISSIASGEDIGTVQVRTFDRPSAETGNPPGQHVSSVQIVVDEGHTDTPSTVEMRVPIDDLDDATPEDVVVTRYVDDSWEQLDTSATEAGDDVILEAETPGFSYFAVTATADPDAAIDITPEIAGVDEDITFSGANSTDRYGKIVAYEWTVDDDTYDGEDVTVAFDEPDEYDVTLTVTNDQGETDTADATVEVTEDAPVEPAEFTVELVSMPDTLSPGETVTIEVLVRNDGAEPGMQDVTITVGEETFQERVELGPGESDELTFTVEMPTDAEAGDATVSIESDDDADAGTVTVEGEEEELGAIQLAGIAGVLLVILVGAGILATRWYTRKDGIGG